MEDGLFMARVRLFTDCGTAPCHNKRGRPGRCVACIDALYRTCGLEPLPDAPYLSPSASRAVRCLAFDHPSEVSYDTVRREKRGDRCEPCALKRIYEREIAATPGRWPHSATEAVQVFQDHGLVFTRPDGSAESDEQAAMRFPEVWWRIEATCARCGEPQTASVVSLLSQRGSPDDLKLECRHAVIQQITLEHRAAFELYGLRRMHEGYVKMTAPVACECLDCGTPRTPVSLSSLYAGATPCLMCAAQINTELPHLVYVIHFLSFRLYKVGITHTERRRYDRIAAHQRHGGRLRSVIKVPNREAALAVERHVLQSVRSHRVQGEPAAFPQGGWTETWSDATPPPDLGRLASEVEEAGNPGFARARDLERYFAGNPITPEELEPYIVQTDIAAEGKIVHSLGATAPYSTILRKVRHQRHSPNR